MRRAQRRGFGLSVAAFVILALVLLNPARSDAGLDLDRYAEILARYTRAVSDTAGTRVDYAGLQESEAWRELVESLAESDPTILETRAEKLAFWINAYNILAIDAVTRAYPIDSILDEGSFFYSVWKRTAGRVGGRNVTLEEIEHDILRPMGEPRIHMAIVCASISCPSLRREPWSGAFLDSQFDDSMRGFLADRSKGMSLDSDAGVIYVSKIFNWFEEDFRFHGGVLAYITPYVPDADRNWLSQNARDIEIRYLHYDWNLNDLAR